MKNAGFIALLILFGLIIAAAYNQPSSLKEIPSTQAIQDNNAGRYSSIVVSNNQLTITPKGQDHATLKSFVDGNSSLKSQGFNTDKATITYKSDSSSNSALLNLAGSVIPVVIIAGLLYFMLRSAQGQGNQALSFGKSRARLYGNEKDKATFRDVAGSDEAKQDLEEVVEFLKFPKKFASMGARIPKGVLLVGPPGTGKTMLARAVAGEANVPFFSISGSEFVEMFVGVGASRVRDLFAKAKKNAPCIIFVDEIDAVGRRRGSGMGGGHDEREQTLNQILVEMDGFDTGTNVIVLASTNRPDVLDPALLRPGRFDRQVVLDRPDIKGRKGILDVHVRGKPLDKTVDLLRIAQISPGFSGADLANVVNEAAILAARRNRKVITQIDFEEALEKVSLGPERRSRVISEKEKNIVAYHEAGHALCFKLLTNTNPVHKISVVSRGMAMGVTWSLPQEDRYFRTKREFEDDIAAALGGWTAEQLHLGGDVTTGASNDIEKATEMARQMVTKYGMSEKLGPLQYGKTDELINSVDLSHLPPPGPRRTSATLEDVFVSLTGRTLRDE